MAQFKIRLVGGDERTVVAQRVVTDRNVTIFESRGGDGWNVVHEVPSVEIDTLQRRVVEFSGMARWITERPGEVTASRKFA